MKWRLLPACFLAISLAAMVEMCGCSASSGNISPDDAKAMILRFLSTPEAVRLGKWVVDSRKLVQEDTPSRLPNGDIVVGPWVVEPATARVYVGIDRAQLEASFQKEGRQYVIMHAEIIEIRKRHD